MAVNIKDFIINIGEEDKKKSEAKTNGKSVPKATYEKILENNTDFVIRRKTQRTNKDLVVLVSQGLFYIKDNKDESVKELSKINSKNILDIFFKDFDKTSNGFSFEKVEWVKIPNSVSISNLISDELSQEFYRYGIDTSNLSKYVKNDLLNLLNENAKLVRYFISSLGDKEINYHNVKTLDGVFTLYRDSGFNNAKYLIDLLKEVEFIKGYNEGIRYIIELIKEYNLNTMSLIEYITYSFKRQGIKGNETQIYYTYRDYLKMNKDIYGSVKEKYPKYLKTQHDMIVYKYNLWNKYRESLMIFEASEENENLAYANKDYSIIVPKTPQDLLEEAIGNNSCLASYISRIADKETMVVFLRRNTDIEQSFLTIEVRNNEIVQVEGYSNTLHFDKDVEKFIKKWADEKELQIKCKLKVKEV